MQALAREFPIGTQVEIDGVMHWLIGFTEDDKLILSPLNPHSHSDRETKATKTYLCADHLRSGALETSRT